MDTLIISKENNILHVCNQEYNVDYTIYNSKGHNMDGGVLESKNAKFDNEIVIKDIIKIIQNTISFNEPYTYLFGKRAENLLELIEMEDYKNLQERINNKNQLSKEIGDLEPNI